MEIMGKFYGLKWVQVRLNHRIILLKIKLLFGQSLKLPSIMNII
jgi:hypothetical protein